MSEERLTYVERWSLAVGAPVIAAGIIAVASFLWALNNSQIVMQKQIHQLVTSAYTRKDAEIDQQRMKNRLDRHEQRFDRQDQRLDRLEQRVLPSMRTGSRP